MVYRMVVEEDGVALPLESGVFRNLPDLRQAVESVLEVGGERARKQQEQGWKEPLVMKVMVEFRVGKGEVYPEDDEVYPEDVAKGDQVRVVVTPWLVKQADLASRELEGEVLNATLKALLVKGSVSVRESRWCLRCGLEIKNPVSRWCGYGPVCSKKLGVERLTMEEMKRLTAEEKEAWKGEVVELTEFERWLPKSQVIGVRVLSDGEVRLRRWPVVFG